MFSFRNIDDFIPGRFEKMGLLKGKRWYFGREDGMNTLFKPKRQEFGDKKVFCGNHYGELIGYLLTLGTDLSACKCELAHLSRYYENIHKERNRGSSIEKDGCITYSELKPGEELEHGKNIVENFMFRSPNLYEELTKRDLRKQFSVDNLEVILASIEERIRNFYAEKDGVSETYIEEKVKNNRKKAIQMMVYDCLYGNNDRHDENWAMKRTASDIELYSLYDNERVLGLYENQTLIENALKNKEVERVSEEVLFSRMRVPGEDKKYSSYKDVLTYLMNNYTVDTQDAIAMFITQNTPEQVNRYLAECQDLPKCYIDFGTEMYKTRYDFAKELYRKKKTISYSPKNEPHNNDTSYFQSRRYEESAGVGEGR